MTHMQNYQWNKKLLVFHVSKIVACFTGSTHILLAWSMQAAYEIKIIVITSLCFGIVQQYEILLLLLTTENSEPFITPTLLAWNHQKL